MQNFVIEIILFDFLTDAKECKSTNNWEFHSQFGHQEEQGAPKLQKACAVTLNKEGDVAVLDYATVSTHLYDNQGQFKRSFDSSGRQEQSRRGNYPWIPQAVVAGPNGNYFLRKDFKHVEMYGATGVLKKTIEVLPSNSPGKLGGLAFDNNGHLLVGVYDHQENVKPRQSSVGVSYVSVPEVEIYCTNFILVLKDLNDEKVDHHATSKIPVSIQPAFVAVTPLNTIIISSLPRPVLRRDPWLQIIDEEGQVIHDVINYPPGAMHWRQCGVCCSSDTIFVTNDNRLAPDEYGVYCYSLSGDYLGCATKEVINPVGIAVSEDGNKMYVAQYEKGNPEEGQGKHGVKVFQRK